MPNVNIPWWLPATYSEQLEYEMGAHRAWKTTVSITTPLITVEGTSTPVIMVNSSDESMFIYHAELSPLAGLVKGTCYSLYINT